MTTISDINKKFDDKFGVMPENAFLSIMSDPAGNCSMCGYPAKGNKALEDVKHFYSSQIRALLEGLKMEKIENHKVVDGAWDYGCDECGWSYFNEAVGLLNQKINTILEDNAVLKHSEKTK